MKDSCTVFYVNISNTKFFGWYSGENYGRKTDIYINVMHPPLTRTKSSGPLGVPLQMMEDPEKVGEKLAGKIMSTKKIVCPDIKTRISIFFTMHFPYSLGKLLSVMTEKVDKK